MKKTAMRLMVFSILSAGLLLSGCAGVKVASHPPGARIFFNGQDTGMLTPTTFDVGELPKGYYMVSLEKEGYVMSGPPQELSIGLHPGKVFGTILFLPIAVPIELGTTKWKRARPSRPFNFVLHPGTSVTPPPAPAVAPPAAVPGASGTAEIEKRLQNLNDLFSKGLITQKEYETRRAAILNDL